MRARLLTVTLLTGLMSHVVAADQTKISFNKTQLDASFRAEGVAVADFNKDGKMDVAAGPVWYAAPDWKMHVIHSDGKEYQPKGYSDCFNAWADDFNADGWPDVLQITWPGKAAVWYENPQGKDGPWKAHIATPVASNESPQYQDIDGDGKRELIIGFAEKNPDAADRRMGIARPAEDPYQPWAVQPISEESAPNSKRYAHGLGIGDVNGDGRKDVVVPQGWWEQPADIASMEWKFHGAQLGQPCADMHVMDVDGDGDADILTSSAHNYGIWWHEQLDGGKWRTHEIDKSFSQTHAMCVADVNGDGMLDFITGKRYWAHGGRDPGGNDPAVFHWFEFSRKDDKPTWTRHQFDHDSGPGTQFQLADVNGDKLIDVVTSNKKGVHVFVQQRD